jgi:hypothetical protein
LQGTGTRSEVNAIKSAATGAITLMAPLQNNYGVGTTITMALLDAGKTTSLAQITTSAVTVTSISPAYIRPSVATTIAMTGPVVAGDLLAFSTNPACGNETVPTIPVTVLTANTSSASFTPTKVGTYYMCYRSVGRTDSVRQTGFSLFVQTKATDNIIKAESLTATTGGEDVTFSSAVPNDGDQVAFVTKGLLCPLASSFLQWTKVTGFSPSHFLKVKAPDTKGTYELCYNGIKTIPFKQTGVLLTVTNSKSSRLYGSAIMDVDEVDAKRADDDSTKTMLLGAGGLVLVAFAVLGVKRATRAAPTARGARGVDEELEQGLE